MGRASSGKRSRIATAILLCLLVAISDVSADQALVVNPDSAPESALPRSAINAIFAMRRTQWSDGTPVRVFVLPDRDPSHVEFCKQLLGVFPHQMRRAWDRMVFAGTGQAPERVDTTILMRERIASTPGAIGYLPEDMIDDSVIRLPVE